MIKEPMFPYQTDCEDFLRIFFRFFGCAFSILMMHLVRNVVSLRTTSITIRRFRAINIEIGPLCWTELVSVHPYLTYLNESTVINSNVEFYYCA